MKQALTCGVDSCPQPCGHDLTENGVVGRGRIPRDTRAADKERRAVEGKRRGRPARRSVPKFASGNSGLAIASFVSSAKVRGLR